jgi:hypothetical protein
MATFRAQLSPNEETTLRRIATATSAPVDLRKADAKRLAALGLVHEVDGALVPTHRGLERVGLPQPPVETPPRRHRLKVRRLLF